MRKFITIDQECVVAWQINYQESVLFSWMYSLPSWASQVFVDGKTFYFASHSKACADLPGLTEKEDTMYRYYKKLEKCGLIEITMINQKSYIRLTEKGKLWNKAHTSDLNPTLGQSSEEESDNHPMGVGQSSDHIDSIYIESNSIDNYPYNPQNKNSTPPALRPGVKFCESFAIPKNINPKVLKDLNDLISKDYSYDMRMMEQAFGTEHQIEHVSDIGIVTPILILPSSKINSSNEAKVTQIAERLAELEVPIYKNYITYLKLYLS